MKIGILNLNSNLNNYNKQNNIHLTNNNSSASFVLFKGRKSDTFENNTVSKRGATAFLYDGTTDDYIMSKLIAENKDVVLETKDFIKKAGIDTGNVIFLVKNGIINQIKVNNRIYFDLLDEKNQEFLKKRPNWVSKRMFVDKYNYTKQALEAEIKNGDYICVVEESDAVSNFIDMSNPINQEALKRHFKLFPKESEYLFQKPENEKNLVPASYFVKLGFSPLKSIVKAIDDGLIDGFAKRITTPDGKKKIRCAVDINSQKSLAALAKIRNDNPCVFEINELRKKDKKPQ